jgi:hypothetical protein
MSTMRRPAQTSSIAATAPTRRSRFSSGSTAQG